MQQSNQQHIQQETKSKKRIHRFHLFSLVPINVIEKNIKAMIIISHESQLISSGLGCHILDMRSSTVIHRLQDVKSRRHMVAIKLQHRLTSCRYKILMGDVNDAYLTNIHVSDQNTTSIWLNYFHLHMISMLDIL